jgi:hypothetical protein
MSDIPYDDPAGRTRFAWARTLLVTVVVALLVERLFFAGSPWSAVVLAVPVGTFGLLTALRSRPLRHDPNGISAALPIVVMACVLLIALAALVGVSPSY